MNGKIFRASMSAAVVLGVTATPAAATIIGSASQSSDQGVNATQLQNAATATGDTIVIGGGGATAGTQTSENTLSSRQGVGGPDGGDTFISPTGQGPFQSNHQGANSQQVSSNGAVSLQGSANELSSSQIVGGGFDCLAATGDCVASTIIGSPVQANQQGVNSSQAADGGVTTGNSITTPTVILNGLASGAVQASENPLSSTQLILG